MAEDPAISIIIPLHNKGPFINETLESVVAQDLMNWELIVVENGSSDGGPECAARWAARDPRIRSSSLPASIMGPGGARNIVWRTRRGIGSFSSTRTTSLRRTTSRRCCGAPKKCPGGDRGLEMDRAHLRPDGNQGTGHQGTHGLEHPGPGGKMARSPSLLGRSLGDRGTAMAAGPSVARGAGPVSRRGHRLLVSRGSWARVAYCSATGAVYRTQTENCRTNLRPSACSRAATRRSNATSGCCGPMAPPLVRPDRIIDPALFRPLRARAPCGRFRHRGSGARRSDVLARERFERGVPVSRSMKLRRLLGIRSFQFLKRACHAIPALMIPESLKNGLFRLRHGFKGYPRTVRGVPFRLDESLRKIQYGRRRSDSIRLGEVFEARIPFCRRRGEFRSALPPCLPPCRRAGRCLSIEPVPGNLRLLRRNLHLNGFTARTRIIRRRWWPNPAATWK